MIHGNVFNNDVIHSNAPLLGYVICENCVHIHHRVIGFRAIIDFQI